MGLCLKPKKCRSLSFLTGKPSQIEFKVDNDIIQPVNHEESIKFLGSVVTFRQKPGEIFDHLRDKLNSILENIDKVNIRDEYKLRICTEYSLPSLRYALTVNDLHTTHLKSLDILLDKYLKKWSSIPKRGANIALLHAHKGLNIPNISELYRTCHSLAYGRSKLKGDDLVNHALDTRLAREGNWTRKSSTTNDAHVVFEKSKHNSWKETKKSIKKSLIEENHAKWKSVIEPLLVQGEFLKILYTEDTDLSWKAIIYNMPQGVMKFAVNAAIDSLPSNKNLYRWGKRLSDKCSLCNATGTLHHVLNNCQAMLNRYSWRHDNILKIILSRIKADKSCKNRQVYADMEGETVNGGTIPPSILPTVQRPDICYFDQDKKQVVIIELTVPFETNIRDAHNRKEDRYAGLLHDLQVAGWRPKLICLEIGSRGLITPDNKSRLKLIMGLCNIKVKYSEIRDAIVKSALMGSYVIFYSRKEPEWHTPQYMNV